MATESTEEHGNMSSKALVFSCSSVDSVAINYLKNLAPGLRLFNIHSDKFAKDTSSNGPF